ncbi:hypothetical protein GGI43DRAFT_4922 [Trichoderma evansii]
MTRTQSQRFDLLLHLWCSLLLIHPFPSLEQETPTTQGKEIRLSHRPFGFSQQRVKTCYDNYCSDNQRATLPVLAKGMSRRDTTSEGAALPSLPRVPSEPSLQPAGSIPASRNRLCLVVGLHEKSTQSTNARLWLDLWNAEESWIPLPNGPCMHCHVDGSGNFVGFFFCRAHARNIESDYNSCSWAPTKDENTKEPPSIRALFLLFLVRHERWWRGARSILFASVAHQLTQTYSVTLTWLASPLHLWFRRWLCRC